MKPLHLNELPAFNERFSHFKDAEFRSLNIISPLHIQTTFAVQDSARAYDWITITLEFNGVSDARLLETPWCEPQPRPGFRHRPPRRWPPGPGAGPPER